LETTNNAWPYICKSIQDIVCHTFCNHRQGMNASNSAHHFTECRSVMSSAARLRGSPVSMSRPAFFFPSACALFSAEITSVAFSPAVQQCQLLKTTQTTGASNIAQWRCSEQAGPGVTHLHWSAKASRGSSAPPEFSAIVRGTTSSASANLAIAYWSSPVSLEPNSRSWRATSISRAPPAGTALASRHSDCAASREHKQ
jgi:hypothetical protein